MSMIIKGIRGDYLIRLSDSVTRHRSISPALEFCAWASVLLALALRYLNGPPVTDDQAAFQIIIAGLSVIAVLALRVYNRKIPRSGESTRQ